MLSEEFISTICGGPLASNTSIAKDVGIYTHTLSPAYSVRGTFKKSSTPTNCLAVNDSHVFAGQHEKAYVHVYSRLRGNQEAFVAFPERIRCLTLAGDVLVVGTTEGRIMLWELCTGRLVSTPPCHVQAVSCLATTQHHILSGSDDSNIHVWTLARLLELDSSDAKDERLEPDRSLANHRSGVTSVVASPGSSLYHSSLCVSASRDKTCVVWNYQTGQPLRTLLFPSSPLCVALDPCARSICVSTSEDGCVYLVELLGGDSPLIGPHATEAATTVVQVSSPFGVSPPEAGHASCLAISYDGTVLLSGHPRGRILRWNLADNSLPAELANVNAAVTNIAFVPLLGHSGTRPSALRIPTVVKPSQAGKKYAVTAQLDVDLGSDGGNSDSAQFRKESMTTTSRFDQLLNRPGFSQETLEEAILAFQQPVIGSSTGEQELQRQNDELLEIVNEQRALYKQLLQHQAET